MCACGEVHWRAYVGKEVGPCLNCGRVYLVYYENKKSNIMKVKMVKKEGGYRTNNQK